MNTRQKKKITKKWFAAYGVKESFFECITRRPPRRRRELLRRLERELDSLMDYYYGRFY